ncbi:MAG TPA: hypothetical protein PLE74_01640 [Candidatus Cloacimonadota bacterium]|nr:hypothetical protein [Candidatus Cloacimonadota bacterium]HPT70968.1 hypothetical protein [Candidatus Cloacimonadota bacterium]
MKVKNPYAFLSLSGKHPITGLIHCYYQKTGKTVVRKPSKFTPTENSRKFARIGKNLHYLYSQVSDGYNSNLKRYALYSREYGTTNSYAIFAKLFWDLQKRYPDINLEQITIEEIKDHPYPIRTLSEAMESGLLMKLRYNFTEEVI